jgi:branched-chain amino acid transport system ATP-binding protein
MSSPHTSAASRSNDIVLATEGLTKSFRGLKALEDQSISIRAGEIVGIIGPNGSGKSTFFNQVTGFSVPDRGKVDFLGHSIVGRKPAEIARRGIARTFQGSRLFRSMTTLENVMVAGQMRTPVRLHQALFRMPSYWRRKAEATAAAMSFLELVNLADQADRPAIDLPYGDQRRLEIARALATQPRLLMLDEPAAGLNSSETRALLDLLRTVRDRFGIAVVVVEHDMDLIMNLCERIQVLATGRVIFEGDPAAVQADQRVREAYLGHS